MAEDKFKLVVHNGKIKYIDKRTLRRYTKENKIANCGIINGAIESVGTYTITKNIQFEEQIAEKYKLYAIKTVLLGNKMSFDYTIEGNQVRLVKYTGTAKDVIVPKFVTTIMDSAFKQCRIETLILDRGLKHIGKYAFEGCRLANVTIPDTVEIICSGAFFGNKRLVGPRGEYTDKIKLLGTNTVVID